MTKTIKTLLIIRTILLIIVPFGAIIALNIIYPIEPESRTLFRIMTIVYLLCDLILMPLNLKKIDSDVDSEIMVPCLLISLSCILILWGGGGWNHFWHIFSRPAHITWSNFGFYLAFTGSWIFHALLLFVPLSDPDEFETAAEGTVLKFIDRLAVKAALPGIAERDISPDVRMAAVKKIDNETDLEHVLLWGEHTDARVEAVKKIKNRELLNRFGENDEDTSLRIEAIKRMDDQDALARIAQNDKNYHVRIAAVNSLVDQNVLVQIAENDTSKEVRINAIRNIESQKALTNIALSDYEAEVRHEAVKKLSDSEILTSIALKDERAFIRKTAASKVNDKDLYTRLALNDPDSGVRESVLDHVDDPETLARMALEDPSPKIRCRVISESLPQEVLEQAARNDSSVDVRRKAVPFLDDPKLLAFIAIEDEDEKVREMAVKKTDSDSLKNAVLNTKAKHIYTPNSWVQTVSDPEVLRIIIKKERFYPRETAVSKIQDTELMKQLALHDSSSTVRKIAAQKITDPGILRRIILNDNSIDVIMTAADQVDDTEAKVIGYEKVLKSDNHYKTAAAKLRDLYLKNEIRREILEEHNHDDVRNDDGSNYCCYEDHEDHDDTWYTIKNL